ncbi:beta strand repeat-containing protein, partial [Parapedobacter pyrenivorans]|uniref:beta strand repeat-containing protein n=1 Tax=Parapedobacter pyrenivorans TaxID=1305674 RepID=UPI001E4A3264
MNLTATTFAHMRAFALRVFSLILFSCLVAGWTASYATAPENFDESSAYGNWGGRIADGTLTFSDNTGLADGIATDGEGGSLDLPGIDIDIFNISNVNGTDAGRIEWRDNGFMASADPTYSGLTYDDGETFNNGTKGMAIKSRDGSEFQINGFTYYNWGETESTTITVRGFRNNVETVFYNFEGYDANYDPIEVTLHSGFDNVDEVRIYIFAGGHLDDQSKSNHSINNIQIADVPLPSPIVTNHPPNRTICNGGNTTFPVTAANATSYQWQENSGAGFTDLAEGGVYSGVNSATLTFTGATATMNGYQYRCRAINASGFATSNPATLTVIAISVSGSQTDVTTGGGNDGTATVAPSGGIMPYTYLWSPEGGTAATATGLTAGTYTVTVTDNVNCSATYEFTVLEPPTLTNIGGPMNFTENGAAVRIVAAGTTLTDGEDITGMALVLDAAPNGSDETIEYDEALNGSSSLASLGLAGGYNSGARTFEVSGTASPTVYQGVLRAMVYGNASEAPETTARAVAVSATNTQGLTEHATVTISITAVNDVPTATNLTQAKTATEGGSAMALDDIVVTDPDASETITAILTLSVPAAGTLSTGTYGSATSTFNAGAGVWTVTGSVADVNAALAAVAFTPSANHDQNFSISTRIRDAAGTGPADGTISVTVTAVNDAPVINPAVTLALDAIDEDAGSPVNGVVSGTLVSTLVGGISDPDTDALQGIAIVAADAANGSWWFSTDGGDSWSVLGTPAATTARLLAADAAARIHFQPGANWNGTLASALTIRAWDRSAGSNGGQANIAVVGSGGTTPFSTAMVTVSLTVNPVADPPTATNMTQTKSTIEDSGTIALDDIVVTDPDAGETVPATLTLSDAAAGTLSTGTYGSATSTFNTGTGVWTVTGSVADVNAALAAVAFTPSIDYDQNFTITTSVRDVAGTGPADGTISVTVTAVNDAPVITAPATIAVTEDVPAVLTGISFADVDAGSGTITVTFSVPSGTPSATGGGGVIVGGTASALTLTGTIANINAYIAASNVTYTTALNAIGDVTLTVDINDNGNTGTGGAQSASETVTLQVTAVNDAPVVTAPATIAVNEDVP